jgi:RNA polymerase sigma-70 factor (ECF subfamily)
MPATQSRVSADPARAIPALFKEFGPRTYAMALRVTGSVTEAEDVVQETFMQAYRRWETFEGRADPGTWLYAIAARFAKKRFRTLPGDAAGANAWVKLVGMYTRHVMRMSRRREANGELVY